jgi:hydroxylysine kinase
MDSQVLARLGEVLEQAPPSVSVAEAESLALQHYGLTATATPLAGERDSNFHLRDLAGHDYVLKAMHPAEDPAVVDFQDQALLAIERNDPTLPVPRLIRPLATSATHLLWQGETGPPRILRVLTYLRGVPFARSGGSGPPPLQDLGRCLARLDLALGSLRHAAESHDLLWNLQYVARARGLLSHIADPARRAIPTQFLDRFERHALPILPGLRAQVIHNDFNPHNVLIDGHGVAGIIDFGDMLRAPLVQDLATAAAYQIGDETAPLGGVSAMVAAYHEVLPLLRAEVEILADLIAARLVLTIAITTWRAARHPDNAAYITRNQETAWRGLHSLGALSRAESQAILLRACRMG